MYYLIKEKLVETPAFDISNTLVPYVAILTSEEWNIKKDLFTMGIDVEINTEEDITKAEVNYDSLTGSFSIPNRDMIDGPRNKFAFALDEKGIVFIDNTNYVQEQIKKIARTKKWRAPSLERFIYDFLEYIVLEDLKLLESYENKLEKIESAILNGEEGDCITKLNDIQGDLLDLRSHYEQLIDLSQELEENENHFFNTENLRFFRLFSNRIERYRSQVMSLREYIIQIRDLYQTQIDVRQNKIMAVLTIITTIFFPLSIITGWYGMNFKHMPELEFPWAYPALVGLCIIIVIFEIIYFKKKKWL